MTTPPWGRCLRRSHLLQRPRSQQRACAELAARREESAAAAAAAAVAAAAVAAASATTIAAAVASRVHQRGGGPRASTEQRRPALDRRLERAFGPTCRRSSRRSSSAQQAQQRQQYRASSRSSASPPRGEASAEQLHEPARPAGEERPTHAAAAPRRGHAEQPHELARAAATGGERARGRAREGGESAKREQGKVNSMKESFDSFGAPPAAALLPLLGGAGIARRRGRVHRGYEPRSRAPSRSRC